MKRAVVGGIVLAGVLAGCGGTTNVREGSIHPNGCDVIFSIGSTEAVATPNGQCIGTFQFTSFSLPDHAFSPQSQFDRVTGAGSSELTVNLPPCRFQIDYALSPGGDKNIIRADVGGSPCGTTTTTAASTTTTEASTTTSTTTAVTSTTTSTVPTTVPGGTTTTSTTPTTVRTPVTITIPAIPATNVPTLPTLPAQSVVIGPTAPTAPVQSQGGTTTG